MSERSKSQHVVPRNGEWAVRGEGNERDTKRFRTQKDAIDAATRIAKRNKAEVLIHGRDGRIRRRLLTLAEEHRSELLAEWSEKVHFGGGH